MLYFVDRFDEVPVRSLVERKHFSNEDTHVLLIISATRPDKSKKTEPVKRLLKIAFILHLVELCTKENSCISSLNVLECTVHVSPSYLDLGYHQVCFQS